MTITQRHREQAAFAILGPGWQNAVGLRSWVLGEEQASGSIIAYERLAGCLAQEYQAGVEEGRVSVLAPKEIEENEE